MDRDIAALTPMLESAPESASPSAQAFIAAAHSHTPRTPVQAQHRVPAKFVAGTALTLRIAPADAVTEVRLHYRHVDQAENYQTLVLEKQGGEYAGAIPAAYTRSRFALEYFFELHRGKAQASLYPGFVPELTNQPYFLVRSV